MKLNIKLVVLLLSMVSGQQLIAQSAVYKIDPDCVASGCFSGDSAGFPVTITQPGSYILTGNLAVSDVNQSAISSTVNSVHIDLNGFTVSGPVTCSGATIPTSCLPAGNGYGIDLRQSKNSSVTDGFVNGFALIGVAIGADARVSKLVVTENNSNGIECTNACQVEHVMTFFNGDSGVSCGIQCQVSSVATFKNKNYGVLAQNKGQITHVASNENGQFGLFLGLYSMVASSVSNDNGSHGIELTEGEISNSVMTGNADSGLDANGRVLYHGNLIVKSVGGATVTGSTAYQTGANVCDFTTTCP